MFAEGERGRDILRRFMGIRGKIIVWSILNISIVSILKTILNYLGDGRCYPFKIKLLLLLLLLFPSIVGIKRFKPINFKN